MDRTIEKLVAELIETGRLESTIGSSPRARIARAALELFAARSYEGTTTKAIAERARTTERTLFKHFKNKDQLFARTVFPAFLKALLPVLLEPAMSPLQVGSGDFRITLRALIVSRITLAVKHPRLFKMIWREFLMRPVFRAAYKQVFTKRARPALDAFIAQGRDAGYLRDLPTDIIVRTIMGQLVAYLVARLVLVPNQRWDTEADADEIVELILRGVGTHG